MTSEVELRVFYPPYCMRRSYDSMMFGTKHTDEQGREVTLFRKGITLYDPKTGRCFTTTDETSVREVERNENDADWPSSHQLLCRELAFVVSRERLQEVPSFPVVFHAKRFNVQLRAIDEEFPTVNDIDRLLRRCYDENDREVSLLGMTCIGIVARFLEGRMTKVGY